MTELGEISASCKAVGLDLSATLQIGQYNSAVPKDLQVDDLGSPRNTALLIGNTKAIWNPFLEHLQSDCEAFASSDPLDDYVEQCVEASVYTCSTKHHIRYAHRPEPNYIAIQRFAELSGLAWTSPARLSIHPHYGPWIALRAVIVFDESLSQEATRSTKTCTCCEHGCSPLFDKLMAELKDTNAHLLSSGWQKWLELRDACPIGSKERYSDQQIHYHYTKDKTYLERVLVEQQLL